jgi:hypothetical protein
MVERAIGGGERVLGFLVVDRVDDLWHHEVGDECHEGEYDADHMPAAEIHRP